MATSTNPSDKFSAIFTFSTFVIPSNLSTLPELLSDKLAVLFKIPSPEIVKISSSILGAVALVLGPRPALEVFVDVVGLAHAINQPFLVLTVGGLDVAAEAAVADGVVILFRGLHLIRHVSLRIYELGRFVLI